MWDSWYCWWILLKPCSNYLSCYWVCVYVEIYGSDYVKCGVWINLLCCCEFCEKWVIIIEVVVLMNWRTWMNCFDELEYMNELMKLLLCWDENDMMLFLLSCLGVRLNCEKWIFEVISLENWSYDNQGWKWVLSSRFSGVKSLIRFEPFNHWCLYFFWGR